MNPLIIAAIAALAIYLLSDEKENGDNAPLSEENASVSSRVLHRGQRSASSSHNRPGVKQRGVAGKTRKAAKGKQEASPASTSDEESGEAIGGSSGEETAS